MRYGKINKQTEGYFDKLVPPTFEEFCRTKFYQFEPGKILTRIERQIGGKIPTEYATVGDLRRVHETLPFTALRIMPGSKVEAFGPPREGIAIRNHLAALGFEALKEQLGSLQIARQFVFKNANGNGQRVLDSLAESLPRSLQGVTLDQIHASFRASSAPQTSRKPEGVICFSPTSELDEFLQTFPSSDGGVDSSPTYDLSI